jgi:aspartate aminotransferase-like enzyme
VYLVHSETSTGTTMDLREMAHLIHEHSRALVCVDGITAVGAHEMRFDEWGIDVCVTGSQKGVMIPPGLSFVALSRRAIDAMRTSTLPKFYLDLREALRAYRENDTPWTPAASLVIGVDAALAMIREEGIEQVWARHRRLARTLRAGVRAMGFRLFSQSPSNAVTAVWLPEGVAWSDFNRALKLDQGITIAGGQEGYRGRIFRVSHLGFYDGLDMIAVVAGLERALRSCGFPCDPGAGLSAAQEALLAEPG